MKKLTVYLTRFLNNADLEKEIKNLVIYKKALINADFSIGKYNDRDFETSN